MSMAAIALMRGWVSRRADPVKGASEGPGLQAQPAALDRAGDGTPRTTRRGPHSGLSGQVQSAFENQTPAPSPTTTLYSRPGFGKATSRASVTPELTR